MKLVRRSERFSGEEEEISVVVRFGGVLSELRGAGRTCIGERRGEESRVRRAV